MDFHEYRAIQIPNVNEALHARMEPANKNDKLGVAMIAHKNYVVGRFAKTIF